MRLILLNPAGLAALAALAAPILVHLLLRRRARRISFPSVRFVLPSNAAAIRLRAITDWPLLVVRCAVVAAAALALARPLVVTTARRDGWNGRTARAIVLDVTPSAGRPVAAAADEQRGSFRSTLIEAAALDAGIIEAIRWLETAPPARREVVVISDFQRGAIDDVSVGRVPASIGLRLRQVVPSDARAAPEPDVRVDVHAPASDRAMADAALRAAGQEGNESSPRPGAALRLVSIYTRGDRKSVV